MTVSVDVVVVNWNSGAQLGDCLESVHRHGGVCVTRTIVVDNGSHDQSLDRVEAKIEIESIRNLTNEGFGAACNTGARLGCSEFLLFLNPDARLLPNALEMAVELMRREGYEDVGICGVQLKNCRGEITPSSSRFPSVLRLVAHAIGIDRIWPGLGGRMVEWAHDQTREVDQVMGAFFLVRRSLFESLGGFDERFFVYYEEVDFSFRAKQAGWRSIFLADACVFHAGGGTSRQVMARRLFYSLRSRVLYAFKHFPILGASLVLGATLLLEPLARSAQALLRRSLTGFKETWTAYGMLLSWLRRWVFQGETR